MGVVTIGSGGVDAMEWILNAESPMSNSIERNIIYLIGHTEEIIIPIFFDILLISDIVS